MKKTYPVSTKAKEWAQHLRPFGKRMANKSTRKINKKISKDDEAEALSVKPVSIKKKKIFAIEFHNGNLRWGIWKKYVTESRRDKSLDNLIKKYKNSSFLKDYKFRVLNLK